VRLKLSSELTSYSILFIPVFFSKPGAEHLIGTFSSRGKACTWLDLSNTKMTTRGLNKIAECMNRSPHVFSNLQTLKLASLAPSKYDDLQVGVTC